MIRLIVPFLELTKVAILKILGYEHHFSLTLPESKTKPMKKLCLVLLSVIMVSTASAQEGKKGWNFGALPTISFDSDLGFQYGALVNLFDYGDGSIFPNYYNMFYVEASHYTKGSSIFRIMYDSDYLIKGIRYTVDLAYLPDLAYDFYGFNGYDAIYNRGWEDIKSPDYFNRMFYRTQRKLFRFKNDFAGKIGDSKWWWNAGLTIQDFNVADVNYEKLNKGLEPGDPKYIDENLPTLYDIYRGAGIISAEEADGGLVTSLKAGVTYDSRDNRACPMKGIWAETGLEVSPSFLGGESTFGKFYLTWRQYFTISERDLGFAYRLGYQTTVFGEVPFYYQTQLIVSAMRGAYSEGLGGGKTLRGPKRNRVVGDGFVYANAELRWKIVHFNFINQKWYLGSNFFGDMGMVTSKIPVDVNALANYIEGDIKDFYVDGNDRPHLGVGAGLKLAMNENFIISADFGKALNKQDGNIGMYIGLNYIF
jgi:hypothetical protein